MAKVYAAPAHLGNPPDFDDPQFRDANGRYDFNAHMAAEEAWVQTVVDAAKAANQGDIVGEIVRFQQGDGYAIYVVWSTNPCTLIHCPVGDNWSIPEAHERGLTTAGLRKQIASAKALDELFSRKP